MFGQFKAISQRIFEKQSSYLELPYQVFLAAYLILGMPPEFRKGVSLALGQGKTGLIALVVNWSFLHAVGVNSICIITVNDDLVKQLQDDLDP